MRRAARKERICIRYDQGLWKFLSSRGESVVKVFDPSDPNSDTKLEGELRAYRVLERLHTENRGGSEAALGRGAGAA